MGVTGLWRLIEPAGKPVPVESLENKVLAVDISIWLHQVVKGYQDAKGAPLPNAHLMGLFQRLCKLLYFRIKPVFVFDGGFPELKKETIARRQDNKTKYNSESERLRREIALLLSKKTAIGSLLGKQISPKKNPAHNNNDDIFKLPALPQKEEQSESESDDEETNSSASTIDLHSVDMESENFKNMPVKEKYDLLVELKETRKMNSWGKLHTLPKKSDNFSDFQLQRLLKRRKVQECLQETEKEMGDTGMSLNELESLLNEEGIDTKIENLSTRRIASDNTTRYLLINNVQHALAEAKRREEAESLKTKVVEDKNDDIEEDLQKAIKMSLECEGESSNIPEQIKSNKRDELEEDLERAIKMSLECSEEPNTSTCTSKTDDSWTSYKSDSDVIESDSEDDDGYEQPGFSTAKAYIMQYSDFTHKTIDNIVASKKEYVKSKTKCRKVDSIIEELNQENSIIVDKVDLSSGDEKTAHNRDISKDAEAPLQGNDSKDQTVNSTKQSDVRRCININDDMDMTQSSVICFEKSCEVIDLNTSTEDVTEMNCNNSKTLPIANVVSSDSSDDDFEEVSELEVKPSKPIVQVTLAMSDSIQDDIFEDVFGNKDPDPNKDNETLNSTNVNSSIKPDEVKNATEHITTERKNELVLNQAKSVERIPEEISCKEDLPDNGVKPSKINYVTDVAENVSVDETPVSEPTDQPNQYITKEISAEALNSMVVEIENKEEGLLQEKGRMERIGRNITEQMTKEAQELLQVFGIPYIVAPMEAEAQCAFLESVNLTDGTITDDSDIWLFGGKTVYKNFFNQKKHVLQFLNERIEKSFNLSREQLILLALLVGSDYTTGVAGVGPVTALEILASFPFNKRQLIKENSKLGQYQQIITGLQEFKTWVKAGRRTDNINLKKKLRNINLGDDFPSVRVVQAYLDPNVEKSKEKFTWGELNITILRDYAKAKFGWSQNKLDVIVQPVIKRMLEHKTQKSLKDYFKRKIEFESLEDQMSKRVKAAVQRMDPENKNSETNVAECDPVEEANLKASQKRKGKGKNQNDLAGTAGPSKGKKKIIVKSENAVVCTSTGGIEINILKTDRYQEVIPQRERDMKNILENKLKAIEVFRKTKIDRKRKPVKKRVNLPKDKAELSESSDSN